VLAQQRRHEGELNARDLQGLTAVTRFAAATAHEVSASFREIDDMALELHREAEGQLAAQIEKIRALAQQGRDDVRQMLEHASSPFETVQQIAILELLSEIEQAEKERDRCDLAIHRPDGAASAALAVRGHRSALAWAFREVVGNAIAHSTQDRPTIDVHVELTRGGWILVRIEDDGTGADQSDLSDLFDPDARTPGRNQSGKGLPLVRGYVQGMGGQVVAGLGVERPQAGLRARAALRGGRSGFVIRFAFPTIDPEQREAPSAAS
jgi:signal transduction histidine kinase